jgi:hypothetical protein
MLYQMAQNTYSITPYLLKQTHPKEREVSNSSWSIAMRETGAMQQLVRGGMGRTSVLRPFYTSAWGGCWNSEQLPRGVQNGDEVRWRYVGDSLTPNRSCVKPCDTSCYYTYNKSRCIKYATEITSKLIVTSVNLLIATLVKLYISKLY